MRKSYYSFTLILSIFLFIGCSQDNSIIDDNPDVKKEIKLINELNVLKFENITVFEATAKKLRSMTPNKQVEWYKSVDFAPLYSYYLEALEKTNAKDINYDEIKDKYANILYFPEYKEDYGIYLPVSKKEYAFLLNSKGEVMIGNEIYNFIDIKNYEALQRTGDALYLEAPSVLRASYNQNVYEGDYIGQQYVSDWMERNEARLRFKLGRYATKPGDIKWYVYSWVLHLEIDVRVKLSNGSWTNTSGQTILDGSIKVPEVSTSELWLGPLIGMGPYPQNLYLNASGNNYLGNFYYFDYEKAPNVTKIGHACTLQTDRLMFFCGGEAYHCPNVTLPEQKYSINF